MTQSNSIEAGNEREKKLPRRDWILLPLLSLMSIALLAFVSNQIARRMFADSGTLGEACMVPNRDPTILGGIPNSACWEKIPEGKLIEYRLNSSGYRADVEFGPKLDGTYRIVIVGSSFAIGARTPIEKAFATRLPEEIRQRTGHKVEIYNEGMAGSGGYPHVVALRVKSALLAKPDLVLWILTPWDAEHIADITPLANNVIDSGGPKRRLHEAWARRSVRDIVNIIWAAAPAKIRRIVSQTRTSLLLQHFLFESQSQYVKSELMEPDEEVGFLKAEPTAKWRDNLRQFDSYAADIEVSAKASGTPFAAVLIPNRAQAAIISMGEWPAGYNPYKLDNELRSIIVSHGGIYIDILPDFRNVPNPEKGYFPVEGHLTAEGHAIVSDLLAKELTSGAIAELKATDQSQPPQERGR
jgi:hypothetical protein